MKKLLFLMMLVALIGCEDGDTGLQEIQESSPFLNTTAGIDETVMARGVNVTVTKIVDGRCPSDFLCLWEGTATVDFKTEGLIFSLKIGESKEFSSYGTSFRLNLVGVTPYSGSQNRNEKKKAVFRIDMI